MTPKWLFPNLGAEEGDDWRGVLRQDRVRTAAQLWSLLYESDFVFRTRNASDPADGTQWNDRPVRDFWPAALGPPPANAVFDWLEYDGQPRAWLNSPSLERQVHSLFATRLSGPSAADVSRIHDKAFAIEAGRALGLLSSELEGCIHVIDPSSLAAPDALIETLDAALARWPAWTNHDYTLKPRFGSSGRGRVPGKDSLDDVGVRGSFARLAKRGGAILEPWLRRSADLSVSLFIPDRERSGEAPTILGSLEMLVGANGVYRGHCGEVDSRGRVFSGHRDDETLRADAAAVATHARATGFFGPCGVDALTYWEGDRERLRSVVEVNARMTMGAVTIGLVRRALPIVRDALDLTPGARRGFIMTFVEEEALRDLEEGFVANDERAIVLDLTSPGFKSTIRPLLLFTRDLDHVRAAHQKIFGG